MQPWADASVPLEGMGPSSEDEEDRLEGIVDVVSIAENSQARSVHERAMSLDESRERLFVAIGQISGEKTRVGIAFLRPRPAVEHLRQYCIRHRLTRAVSIRHSMSICPQRANRSSKKRKRMGFRVLVPFFPVWLGFSMRNDCPKTW